MKKLLTFLFISISLNAFSQQTSPPPERPAIKFGEVKAVDFSRAPYAIDSSADAVVLLDIGNSEFVGNSESNFNLVYTHQKRIHIINKNGFDHATVQIPLYLSSKRSEEIKSLVAYTYNLENGKVVSTKIDKGSIFVDKQTSSFKLCKFTFSNLKEGSIIEYKYVVESPFIQNLQPWDFQDVIPTLWSEYTVRIPKFYDFLMLYQGYRNFDYTNTGSHSQSYRVTVGEQGAARQSQEVTTLVTSYTWALKNVSALKFENFTTTIQNHIQRIFFQLKTIQYNENKPPYEVMSSWDQVMNELIKNEDFGGTLGSKHAAYQSEIEPLILDAKDEMEKAFKIFHYVKGRFKRTGFGSIFLNQSVKKLSETKTGTASEINLYLIAMLKGAGLNADPVILSTRSNGMAPDLFPVLSKYNHVICRVVIQNKNYYLDASNKKMGFGKLPYQNYNGIARLVNVKPVIVELVADSLSENSSVNVSISNTANPGVMEGSYSGSPGYFKSCDIRSELDVKSKEEYFKEMAKDIDKIQLAFTSIEGVDKFEEPVSVYYEFKFNVDEDVIYFNPMFNEGIKENPFKNQRREYPVEMPYKTVRSYILTMDVPEGYEVDEIPETEKVLLNDSDGYFEYKVNKNGKRIMLVSKVILTKATFENSDYEPLREFFGIIVKKHAEQIVFKKIK